MRDLSAAAGAAFAAAVCLGSGKLDLRGKRTRGVRWGVAWQCGGPLGWLFCWAWCVGMLVLWAGWFVVGWWPGQGSERRGGMTTRSTSGPQANLWDEAGPEQGRRDEAFDRVPSVAMGAYVDRPLGPGGSIIAGSPAGSGRGAWGCSWLGGLAREAAPLPPGWRQSGAARVLLGSCRWHLRCGPRPGWAAAQRRRGRERRSMSMLGIQARCQQGQHSRMMHPALRLST